MTTQDLAGLLCKDMVRGVFERGGRSFIVTRFSYPVGDSVNLYVVGNGDGLRVSDMGTTHYALSVGGIDMTDRRRDFIRSVCALYSVDFDDRTLTKRITPDSAGRDVLSFCEAITRISTMEYDAQTRQRSHLSEEIETLVVAKIDPYRPVTRHWTDERFDEPRAHIVDYHMNTVNPSVNLYGVTSTQRAETVANIIRFWQTRVPAKSIAVVDPEVDLPEKTAERLRAASDRTIRGVAGNEQLIVGIALEGLKPRE